MIDPVLQHIDATLDTARQNLFAFLAIPSISAQPAHAQDCRTAASWALRQLEALGFTGTLHETPGHPVVLAHHPGTGRGGPHLLYYGHYDVQPPDPVALWTSPPFTPTLVDGPRGPRVVARGAVDDKGQVMSFIEAFRAWTATHGGVPLPITVLLEGEEEVGSVNLEGFLAAHGEALRADFAVLSDTNMWDVATPAITTRLRGLVYVEITVRGAKRDLHSGLYGGSALNPLNVLASIIGALHDADGRVQLPGFYDGVKPVSETQAAQWAGLGFDEGAFLGDIGLTAPGGERGLPALVRLWARPTADVNGIWGGYTGPGAKTVIAGEATAKLSCRLVPDQDPEVVFQSIGAFVRARLPAGARAEIVRLSQSPGIEIPTDLPVVRAAAAALADEFGRPPVLNGSGGSVPVVESIKRMLGLDSLLMGFGLDDDQIHSPNEKFELRCFHHGIRSHARLLGKLAGGA